MLGPYYGVIVRRKPRIVCISCKLIFSCLLQATLCYYDVRDALSLDPYQPQALKLMEEIESTARACREQAVVHTLQVSVAVAEN